LFSNVCPFPSALKEVSALSGYPQQINVLSMDLVEGPQRSDSTNALASAGHAQRASGNRIRSTEFAAVEKRAAMLPAHGHSRQLMLTMEIPETIFPLILFNAVNAKPRMQRRTLNELNT
jgi:hypothetical protein